MAPKAFSGGQGGVPRRLQQSLLTQSRNHVPHVASQTGFGEAGWWDVLGDRSLYRPLLGAPGHGPSPRLLGVKGSVSTVVPDTTRAAKTKTP